MLSTQKASADAPGCCCCCEHWQHITDARHCSYISYFGFGHTHLGLPVRFDTFPADVVNTSSMPVMQHACWFWLTLQMQSVLLAGMSVECGALQSSKHQQMALNRMPDV